MYKYVFFDMDGTVLDTIEDLKNAVNYTMRHFGYPEIDTYQTKHYTGNASRHLITMACPDGTEIDPVLEFYSKYYKSHCAINTKPYDGILDLMAKLKSRGIKMAVVSNKMDGAVKDLAREWFGEYIDVAVGEKDGLMKKPAPDLVNEAMRLMKANKAESVYIGDTEVDIKTAFNSDLPCIAVTWGFRDFDEIKDLGAMCYCNNTDEVFDKIIE